MEMSALCLGRKTSKITPLINFTLKSNWLYVAVSVEQTVVPSRVCLTGK